MLSMGQFWYVLNNYFIGFEETSSYWSSQFFSVFLWSQLIGKPCMTPVSKDGTSHLSSGGAGGGGGCCCCCWWGRGGGGEGVFIFI